MQNQTSFSEMLMSKQLLDVSYFNINDNFFVFDDDQLAIIDGGVTLFFQDQTLSLCFNQEVELFNYSTQQAPANFGDLDYYEIEKSNFDFASSVINQKVVDVETHWTWFQELNEDFEPYGEKKDLLQGLTLSFENGEFLRLAVVFYQLSPMGASGFEYDSKGELLVTTNRELEITVSED